MWRWCGGDIEVVRRRCEGIEEMWRWCGVIEKVCVCCSPALPNRKPADNEPQTVVQTDRGSETENPNEKVHCGKAEGQ